MVNFVKDQHLQCRDCGAGFIFSEGEQAFYAEKGLSAPLRCKACRNLLKAKRTRDREMHSATCAQCGAECEVPFRPRPLEEGGRPVLCKACFMSSRAIVPSMIGPHDGESPSIVIVWDPELVSEEDYGELVAAVGNLVRSEGGIGVERIGSLGFGVPCEVGVAL